MHLEGEYLLLVASFDIFQPLLIRIVLCKDCQYVVSQIKCYDGSA